MEETSVKGGTDEQRRKHHTELLQRILESEFAGCEVTEQPPGIGAIFWVTDLKANQRYGLKVSPPVLDDNRTDLVIENKVKVAAAFMRENPYRMVFLDSRGAFLTTALLNEELPW